MRKVPINALVIFRRAKNGTLVPIKLKNAISEKRRRVTVKQKLEQMKFNIVHHIFKFENKKPITVNFKDNREDDFNLISVHKPVSDSSKGSLPILNSIKDSTLDDKITADLSPKLHNRFINLLETIEHMRTQINSSIRKLRWSVLLEFIVCIIVCFVLHSFIADLSYKFYDRISSMTLFSDFRDDLLKLATLTQSLHYKDLNILTTQSRESLVNSLGVLKSDLSRLTHDITYSNFNYQLYNLVYDPHILWNSYNDGNFSVKHINFIDAAQHIINLISKIEESLNITQTDSFFELYRNIPAEVQETFNNTLYSYTMTIESSEIEEIQYFLNITTVISIFLFLSFTLASVLILILLHKIRRRIWVMTIKVSRAGINLVIRRLNERLLYSHREDQDNLSYDTIYTKIHNTSFSLHKYQKLVYICIGFNIIAYSLSGLYPSFTCTARIQSILNSGSVQLYSISYQKFLVLILSLLTRESMIYPFYFSNNQHFYNYTAVAYTHLNELQTYLSDKVNPDHYSTDMILRYFGDFSSSEEYLGVRPLAFEYIYHVRDLLNNKYPSYSGALVDLEELDTLKESLDSGYLSLQEQLQDHIKSQINSEIQNQLNFFVFYFVFILFTLVCITCSMIYKLKRQLKHETQLLLYMPREESSTSY